MTPRQREALGAVQRFVRERSRAPSVGELAGELDVSHEQARRLVVALEDAGAVMRGVVPAPTVDNPPSEAA